MTLARLRAEDRREAREEGIAIGEERGARNKALETARNFLRMGLTAAQIAEGVGLPLSEVQALIKAETHAEIAEITQLPTAEVQALQQQ